MNVIGGYARRTKAQIAERSTASVEASRMSTSAAHVQLLTRGQSTFSRTEHEIRLYLTAEEARELAAQLLALAPIKEPVTAAEAELPAQKTDESKTYVSADEEL